MIQGKGPDRAPHFIPPETDFVAVWIVKVGERAHLVACGGAEGDQGSLAHKIRI
jgi:hypothetical protein